MNWYNKILLASHDFYLSPEILNDIHELSRMLIDYVRKGRYKKEFLETIRIQNPYTGKEESVNVNAEAIDDKSHAGAIAIYDRTINGIYVFPYRLNPKTLNDAQLLKGYQIALRHEVTHFLDPKFNNKTELDVNKNPLLEEYEFDAYSRQITDLIRDNLPNEKETVGKWLRSQNLIILPKFLSPYFDLLELWRKEKPEFIRRLSVRIYNDCLSGE